ncbi:MAG: hypothetical protein HC921_22235 [Synechococcaceae cyanobacterium SM2_3_1]|nr:hypothetical protein [Synechococcaceae cyanobacterium SM2_3_1]
MGAGWGGLAGAGEATSGVTLATGGGSVKVSDPPEQATKLREQIKINIGRIQGVRNDSMKPSLR